MSFFLRAAISQSAATMACVSVVCRSAQTNSPREIRIGHRHAWPGAFGFFTLISGARVRIGFDRPIKRGVTISAEHDLKNVPNHGWRGAREGSWIAYTHRIPIPTLDVHAIDRYLWVAPLLGLDDNPPDLTIHLSPEASGRVNRLLEEHDVPASKPLVVLCLAQFGRPSIGQLKDSLVLRGNFFRMDLPSLWRAPSAINSDAGKSPPQRLGHATFPERQRPQIWRRLFRRAEVAVTNDSGSMHVAASLGKPMVSVFGPTNPVHIGPYERPESVVRVDLPCSPCNYRRLSQCPFDHACMKQVTSAMVVERVRKILSAAKSHPEECGGGRRGDR